MGIHVSNITNTMTHTKNGIQSPACISDKHHRIIINIIKQQLARFGFV